MKKLKFFSNKSLKIGGLKYEIKLKEDNEKLQNELNDKLTYINSLEEQIVKLKEEINERDERISASTD